MSRKKRVEKITVGWREWCALPVLGIPAIKVKVDTGAATSALHAYNIKPFEKDGRKYVRFEIHPLQKNNKVILTCEAPLVDRRHVRSSTGHKQKRYVIATPIQMGDKVWDIEITLTNRDSMSYRMLLGRQAMRGHIVVDPGRSFRTGRWNDAQAVRLCIEAAFEQKTKDSGK